MTDFNSLFAKFGDYDIIDSKNIPSLKDWNKGKSKKKTTKKLSKKGGGIKDLLESSSSSSESSSGSNSDKDISVYIEVIEPEEGQKNNEFFNKYKSLIREIT